YYYGPTSETDSNPLQPILSNYVDTKIASQKTVKEVLPKGANTHSIISYDLGTVSSYQTAHPGAIIQTQPHQTEPFYCNSSYARVCWNVLGMMTQMQIDESKQVFWDKIDRFQGETLDLFQYNKISQKIFAVFDNVFIDLERGFMYFYYGLIFTFLFAIPHIALMTGGRIYWVRYVYNPNQSEQNQVKRRKEYIVPAATDQEDDSTSNTQKDDHLVVSTNENDEVVMMVVKTKRGQQPAKPPSVPPANTEAVTPVFPPQISIKVLDTEICTNTRNRITTTLEVRHRADMGVRHDSVTAHRHQSGIGTDTEDMDTDRDSIRVISPSRHGTASGSLKKNQNQNQNLIQHPSIYDNITPSRHNSQSQPNYGSRRGSRSGSPMKVRQPSIYDNIPASRHASRADIEDQDKGKDKDKEKIYSRNNSRYTSPRKGVQPVIIESRQVIRKPSIYDNISPSRKGSKIDVKQLSRQQ
ncbi:MAG: hypothetical protein EZS28_035194, partial [Streblomastix strix]